ncbi:MULTISPECIES: high-potential iron-sulfur protein [Photobacterium]|uniref:High-potential iron-sulfur protein n=1 Tax=Photobacterium ganghwense TaxID=320778 RepID=A0A0J1HCN1_9GAMM|nr:MULTISPECIES: high-potential iron-sulfur protein [Photobacterium]KLV09398.1 high-potential iron sulfur protein 2 [Photobacterium ganghwense]MBV1839471.1 high-potential iron-sulfur protein [Photobacterium ganghwense]PSU08549.1 high-potential iron sulfur protein 2 [Photobacterium ganghwense]QSV15356.1 high-potential iron-sulfur protein [Photobacterium ganghwense]
MNRTSSRRGFLKLSLGSLIGITIGNQLLVKPARAEDLPHLTSDDPQAKALKYVEQAPDSEKHCGNCALLQGNEGDEWRPCALFPGKAVNVNGWCSAWAKKP